MKNKIEKISYLVHTINQRNLNINRLKEENEESSKLLKELSEDEEVKQLIINNLHIEDNGEPRKLSSEYSYTTRDGVIVTDIHEYDNTNASFNPELDKFDIVDIEFNYDEKLMRIKVDCIRRHKYINAFMWEPDYYWTDYINLNDYDNRTN